MRLLAAAHNHGGTAAVDDGVAAAVERGAHGDGVAGADLVGSEQATVRQP